MLMLITNDKRTTIKKSDFIIFKGVQKYIMFAWSYTCLRGIRMTNKNFNSSKTKVRTSYYVAILKGCPPNACFFLQNKPHVGNTYFRDK